MQRKKKEQKWKRGETGDYGCDNTKSVNIDLTNEFVWKNVKDIVAKSSILKKEFKEEYFGKVKTKILEKNLINQLQNKIRADLLILMTIMF